MVLKEYEADNGLIIDISDEKDEKKDEKVRKALSKLIQIGG